MSEKECKLENQMKQWSAIRNSFNQLLADRNDLSQLMVVLQEKLKVLECSEKSATANVTLLRNQLLEAHKIIHNLNEFKQEATNLKKEITEKDEELEKLTENLNQCKIEAEKFKVTAEDIFQKLQTKLDNYDSNHQDLLEGVKAGYIIEISELNEQLSNYEQVKVNEMNSLIFDYENKLSELTQKFSRYQEDNRKCHEEKNLLKAEVSLLKQKLKYAEDNKPTIPNPTMNKPKRNYNRKSNDSLIPQNLLNKPTKISRVNPMKPVLQALPIEFNNGQVFNPVQSIPNVSNRFTFQSNQGNENVDYQNYQASTSTNMEEQEKNQNEQRGGNFNFKNIVNNWERDENNAQINEEPRAIPKKRKLFNLNSMDIEES